MISKTPELPKVLEHILSLAVDLNAADLHFIPDVEAQQVLVKARPRDERPLTELARWSWANYKTFCTHLERFCGLRVYQRLPDMAAVSVTLPSGSWAVQLESATNLSLAMRLTPSATQSPLRLDELGLDASDFAEAEHLCTMESGVICLAGSVGDGRDTFINACLLHPEVRRRDCVIIHPWPRVEVPNAEHFVLEGAGWGGDERLELADPALLAQSEALFERFPKVSADKLTRFVRRRAPEVLYLREVHSLEMVELCFEMARRGTLVFTTLHASDATSIPGRFGAMKLEPKALRNVQLVCRAQRRLARLCPHCRQPQALSPASLKAMGLPEDQDGFAPHRAVGCEQCNEGHKGWVLVQETHRPERRVLERALSVNNFRRLRPQALKDGLRTLRQHALERVANAEISMIEAMMKTPPR